jgi:hypothetical protein
MNGAARIGDAVQDVEAVASLQMNRVLHGVGQDKRNAISTLFYFVRVRVCQIRRDIRPPAGVSESRTFTCPCRRTGIRREASQERNRLGAHHIHDEGHAVHGRHLDVGDHSKNVVCPLLQMSFDHQTNLARNDPSNSFTRSTSKSRVLPSSLSITSPV